jgi:hypothetical protein
MIRALACERGQGPRLLCAAFVLALGDVAASSATQLAYEPFAIGGGPGEYQLGPIHGQPAVRIGDFFAGPWVAPPEHAGQAVQAAGILPNTAGGSVIANGNGRAGRYLAQPWTHATVGVFYLSFLARFGTVADPLASDGGPLGFRTIEFWPAGNKIGDDTDRMEMGYNAFVGTAADRSPTTARLRFAAPGGGPQYLTGTTFNEDNDRAHWIVLKFELQYRPAGDRVSVFLDPVSPQEPIVPHAMAENLDFTLGALGTVSFFSSDPTGGVAPAFDEIRVGTTFADVAPPQVPEGPCSSFQAEEACYLEILSHMHLAGEEVGFADLNGDSRVTIADFRFWKDRRVDISSAGAAAVTSVPEPGTWLCVIVAATIYLGIARFCFCRY